MSKTHSCVRSMSCGGPAAGKVQAGRRGWEAAAVAGAREGKEGPRSRHTDISEAGEASQMAGNGEMSTLEQIF